MPEAPFEEILVWKFSRFTTSDHIAELQERKESLESAADEARAVLAERRQSGTAQTPSQPSQRR